MPGRYGVPARRGQARGAFPFATGGGTLPSVNDVAAEGAIEGWRSAWLARVSRAGGRAARASIGLIYPPTCIGCRGATGEAHTLCPRCWSEVKFIERPFCERLGTPFAVDLGI